MQALTLIQHTGTRVGKQHKSQAASNRGKLPRAPLSPASHTSQEKQLMKNTILSHLLTLKSFREWRRYFAVFTLAAHSSNKHCWSHLNWPLAPYRFPITGQHLKKTQSGEREERRGREFASLITDPIVYLQ